LTSKATRLYPLPPREITAEGGIYEDLELPPALPPARRGDSPPGSPRPYVIINMVASIDGRVALGGKASRIGSEVDRRTMRNLRSKADAVMIGAGTLRSERLSLDSDRTFGAAQPLAVIVTKTGDVPLESNLIGHERQRVLVLTTGVEGENGTSRSCGEARLLRAPTTPSGDADLGRALRILQTEHAVDILLVEGGPSLNHSLVSQNLADELFLTLAPKLLGGPQSAALALLEGPELSPLQSPRAELVSVYLSDGELYLRYRLR
jgi:2,5-diamino-6-(ribosylamino)-4(3H)-pyrimidinone 5'-phosphate reductase